MLIGAVEETAKIRLNAWCVEVVPAHYIDPGAGRIFAGVQPYLGDVKPKILSKRFGTMPTDLCEGF